MLKNVVLWLSRFFNTIQIHRFDVPHIYIYAVSGHLHHQRQRHICFLDLKGFLGRNVNVSSKNNAREVNPRLKTYMSITTCSAEMRTMYGMRLDSSANEQTPKKGKTSVRTCQCYQKHELFTLAKC